MTTNTHALLSKLAIDPSSPPDVTSSLPEAPDVARGFARAEALPSDVPAWAQGETAPVVRATRSSGDDAADEAAWHLRRDIEREPHFVPALFAGRSVGLELRRWAPDPRVIVMATNAGRVVSEGTAAYIPGLGWALAPGSTPSGMVLAETDGEHGYCLINADGLVQISLLDAAALAAARSPQHVPELAAWLDGVAVAPWLHDRVRELAASDDGFDHAVAAGLVARFALATSLEPAAAIMQRLTGEGPSPAQFVAAWAKRAPSKWLQDRWVDIDTQLDGIEELFDEIEVAHEDADAPPGMAASMAARVSEAREEVACIASILLASGNEATRGMASAIDRVGLSRVHTGPFRERPRDELLVTVGRIIPDAWWGLGAP